jgi:hypothetical protein
MVIGLPTARVNKSRLSAKTSSETTFPHCRRAQGAPSVQIRFIANLKLLFKSYW